MKRPPVTISLGKSTQFAAKDTTPGLQMSSLEDIHALIKDEALNQHHEKRSPFSNESLDLVQMDEEMMPKNSQSPESPQDSSLSAQPRQSSRMHTTPLVSDKQIMVASSGTPQQSTPRPTRSKTVFRPTQSSTRAASTSRLSSSPKWSVKRILQPCSSS